MALHESSTQDGKKPAKCDLYLLVSRPERGGGPVTPWTLCLRTSNDSLASSAASEYKETVCDHTVPNGSFWSLLEHAGTRTLSERLPSRTECSRVVSTAPRVSFARSHMTALLAGTFGDAKRCGPQGPSYD